MNEATTMAILPSAEGRGASTLHNDHPHGRTVRRQRSRDAVAATARHSAWRVPSLATCGCVIALVKLRLALSDFAKTYAWLRRRVLTVPVITDVPSDFVLATEQAVALAAALYPGRAQCLERSLALYFLLRREGVDVAFRMGVQARPFAAHAWIEYCGAPINDVVEHVKRYVPLADAQL